MVYYIILQYLNLIKFIDFDCDGNAEWLIMAKNGYKYFCEEKVGQCFSNLWGTSGKKIKYEKEVLI